MAFSVRKRVFIVRFENLNVRKWFFSVRKGVFIVRFQDLNVRKWFLALEKEFLSLDLEI